MRMISIAFCIVVCSGQLFAQMLPLSPVAKAARMKAFGGDVVDRRKQAGEIVVVNAQSAVSNTWVVSSVQKFSDALHVAVKYREGTFDVKQKCPVGVLSLYVVNDPTLPMSLISPEARWAMVNVAALKTDNVAFYQARVSKEAYRVLGMLCGAFSTKFEGCVFGAVSKPDDLDQIIEAGLPLEYYERFRKYLPGMGIVPYRLVRYDKACEQGWAPQPTNEYQRVVWEKVHAAPTAPIVIKPEAVQQK